MLDLLKKVLDGKDLGEREMERLMLDFIGGEVPHSRLGAMLAALRMKGESLSELVGAARMLRRRSNFIDCGVRDVVDVVGTGGDGGISFNISTTSSFVAAGAGVTVAKHGNRAVSGKCGAADVLAELGFNLQAEPEKMEHAIKSHGIGFLFAPRMHPVLGAVSVLRRELGVRTIFNMLGPLCNPAGATGFVLGVYDTALTELFAEALRALGAKRALVVAAHDGLDEISCGSPTRVAELKDGMIKSYDLYPELLLEATYPLSSVGGGEPGVNASILLSVLEGRDRGAARAVVLLNAGAAIYVAGLAPDLRAGIAAAAESIDSGRALEKLRILIGESNR